MISLSHVQARTHPFIATVIGVGFYLVATAVLAFFPLGRSVGMEYSLVLSIVAALITPALATLAGAHLIGRDPRVMFESLAAILLPTLLPPVLTGIIFVLLPSCDPSVSLVFYLLGPPASALLSLALVALIGRVFNKPWIVVTTSYLIVFASLSWTLKTLYDEPLTFFFNHFFGAYYGMVYDEIAGVDDRLLHFRLLTWLWALGLLLLARASLRKPGRVVRRAPLWAALFLLVAFGLSVHLWNPLHPTHERIEKALGQQVKTTHFTIFADRSFHKKELQAIAKDHEFRYAQIKSKLGVVPQKGIRSYYYASAQSKARMMGAAGTQLARPWQLEMHLNGQSAPHPVLAHELVHVLSADMGTGLLKTSSRFGLWIRPGLIEGLAVALEPDDGELSLLDQARALKHFGQLPSVNSILSLSEFSTEAPARAYVAAGAFVGFLLEKHGVGRVREFYRTADFASLAGEDEAQIQKSWEAWLDAAPVSPNAIELSRRRFERSSFFDRRCVHAVQAQYQQVQQAMNQSDWDKAFLLLQALHAAQPKDLRSTQFLLNLASMAERANWLQLSEQWLRSVGDPTQVEKAEYAFARSKIAWVQGEHGEVCEQLPVFMVKSLPSSQRRMGQVLDVLCAWKDEQDPAVREASDQVFAFLFSDGPEHAGGRSDLLALEQAREKLKLSGHPIAQVMRGLIAYLMGRQLVKKDPSRAQSLFDEFLRGPIMSAELRVAAFHLRGRSALLAKNYSQAAKDFARSLASAMQPYARQAKDDLERLRFEKNYHGKILISSPGEE